jgi:hypothetical protein
MAARIAGLDIAAGQHHGGEGLLMRMPRKPLARRMAHSARRRGAGSAE